MVGVCIQCGDIIFRLRALLKLLSIDVWVSLDAKTDRLCLSIIVSMNAYPCTVLTIS